MVIGDGGLQSWVDFCQNNSDAAVALGISDFEINWNSNTMGNDRCHPIVRFSDVR